MKESQHRRTKQLTAGVGALMVAGGLGFGAFRLLSPPNFCDQATQLSEIDLGGDGLPPVDSLREAARSYEGLAEAGGKTEGAARTVASYLSDLADAVEADATAGPDDELQAASVITSAITDSSLTDSNATLAAAVEACPAQP